MDYNTPDLILAIENKAINANAWTQRTERLAPRLLVYIGLRSVLVKTKFPLCTLPKLTEEEERYKPSELTLVNIPDSRSRFPEAGK